MIVCYTVKKENEDNKPKKYIEKQLEHRDKISDNRKQKFVKLLTFFSKIYIIEKIRKKEKKMKEQFIQLLKGIKREGMEELINFLEKSDFFIAPASTRFHGDHEGGLVEHSLKVYEILKHKVQNGIMPIDIPEESIIIIGLLHDICKTNFYKVDYRNAKNALGVWEKVPYYTVDDTIPYGHGEKSVMMITEYIKLTPEEKYSIRWHMGYTEPKENYNAIGSSYTKYPIALLTHEADLEATYLYDT